MQAEADPMQAEAGAEPACRRPGRPRSADADRAIIAATLELLTEAGVGALAVEQVAARSGVAKATIYRRWPNKKALILDALATVEDPDASLPGSSLRDDLLALARNLIGRSLDADSSRLYAWMAAEGSRSPEIEHRYRSLVVEHRRQIVREVLQKWQLRGELRADLDVETALLLVVGPMLVYRLHWSDEATSDDFFERLVDAMMGGLAAHPAG
jgi:AcrR family transcriptional regulator